MLFVGSCSSPSILAKVSMTETQCLILQSLQNPISNGLAPIVDAFCFTEKGGISLSCLYLCEALACGQLSNQEASALHKLQLSSFSCCNPLANSDQPSKHHVPCISCHVHKASLLCDTNPKQTFLIPLHNWKLACFPAEDVAISW